MTSPSRPAVPALVAVTAVWGLTFVQVKDAVALYPVMPFLALRFGIAALVLAPLAFTRAARAWPARHGVGCVRRRAARRRLRAPDLGLERTSVSSAGFITGMYVVLTPLIAFVCFRIRIGASVWGGVALATGGLALLAGVHGGPQGGNALVLAGAAVYSLQIVLMERYAPRYDALGFTLVEMLAAFALLGVVAVPTMAVPRGWTVWGPCSSPASSRARSPSSSRPGHSG